MIVSFSSGTTTSLVAKNETKELFQLFEDGFWCLMCLNDCIYLPDMIGSFASGAMASLVAKNGTKNIPQLSQLIGYLLFLHNISLEPMDHSTILPFFTCLLTPLTPSLIPPKPEKPLTGFTDSQTFQCSQNITHNCVRTCTVCCTALHVLCADRPRHIYLWLGWEET